jgi:hypothetical protein
MSQIVIDGTLVSGPDQFKVLILEALKRRPNMVTRPVPIRNVVARLASYSSMWQAEAPVLGLDQEVSLKQVLVDVCGMLNLSDDDRIFILGKQGWILEEKPVRKNVGKNDENY